jgi:diaminohydroxyphosphoribosylaminopyrimidine deaminase / 5-amino-6-(5-phosphoribosylamino)uracil reductase
MTLHEKYMHRCLELAGNGKGNVSPNPLVGSVIVCDDAIIGEGYHIRYGGKHAEANAIDSVKNTSLFNKATLYVSLEPCSHFGKTPPCSDLIIAKKIPRVVIGAHDSNPIVSGKGIEKLRRAGIEVIEGCLEIECRQMNKRFLTFHEKQRPYIILKWAESADGFIDKIREQDEKPVWITDDMARITVHKWRTEEDAVIIGTNTALMDDPKLNVRLWSGKNPTRIVFDRSLRLPANLKLFDGSQPTLVFTEQDKEDGQNLIFVKIPFNISMLNAALRICYEKRIQSVIVEGGSKLLGSFIASDLWDEARIFKGEISLKEGIKAPVLSDSTLTAEEKFSNSVLRIFQNKSGNGNA